MNKVIITFLCLLFSVSTGHTTKMQISSADQAAAMLGSREELCTIIFPVNSKSLTAEARQILSDHVAYLKSLDLNKKIIRIEGFASPEGDQTKNFRLSIDRARAVESFLRVDHGVLLNNYISGFGPTKPSNVSAAGKRSVQIAIYDNPWGQVDSPLKVTDNK